jgi:hypothetical protein
MNAAGLAEPMLGRLRIELVCRQALLPSKKNEVSRRRYEVDETLLGADRTIALESLVVFDPDLEADGAAMTATFVPGLG